MRNSTRGLSLLEVLIATGLILLLSSLVLNGLATFMRFYERSSTKSCELGSASILMERIENACYGLPRQALTLEPGLLSIQPLEQVSSTGRAVYADSRIAIESSEQGVVWWKIGGQERGLGIELKSFPPISPDEILARKTLMTSGWTFVAEFQEDRFPLTLLLTGPDKQVYHRTLAAQL